MPSDPTQTQQSNRKNSFTESLLCPLSYPQPYPPPESGIYVAPLLSAIGKHTRCAPREFLLFKPRCDEARWG